MSKDTYSTEELMELGEKILAKAHTQEIVEREEREVRDEIIDEADRVYEEGIEEDAKENPHRGDVFNVDISLTEDGACYDNEAEIYLAVAKMNGMVDNIGGVSQLDVMVVEKCVGVILGDEDAVEFIRNVIQEWDRVTCDAIGVESEYAECGEQTYTATEHHMALEKAYQDGVDQGRIESTSGNLIIQKVEHYHA